MSEESPTSKHAQLLASGHVTLTGPRGERVEIRGAGERVEVDINRSALIRGFGSRLLRRGARRRWLLAGQPALEVAGLSVDVLIDGRRVGRYGGHTSGGIIARLLGLGPAEFDFLQLLKALIRRPPQ
jgi:hypothetical protein